MSDITKSTIIKLHDHGPLRVKGPVTVLDAEGNAFEITRKSFFLCRCGASRNKPFCDGSHNEVGFRADERAEGL
ncbi:MAG: CDGSH iron-sulfur domain-containing protein [Solirubrobacterales bacterium]|nr:CDGSH iron-sulfur domain-containing protein [Solirubrobacterales bacterium]